MSRPAQEVILRPVFTEKTSQLQFDGTDAKGRRIETIRERGVEARSKYTFEVALDATKVEIRHAIESMFDVRVRAVRTVVVRGKKRRQGRHVGQRPDWKKAIVEIAEGAIDVFEGV